MFFRMLRMFNRMFNIDTPNKPMMPAKYSSELRIRLLQEELDELKQAVADNDLVEVADALIDLQYVLTGTALAFGITEERFDKLFREDHNSNMSKVDKTWSEAKDTQQAYLEKGIASYVEMNKQEKWLVKRLSDDKVLKSLKYKAPELKQFLALQSSEE